MKILILGAKGRFGRNATQAALAAGHQVIAFARSWDQDAAHPNLTYATGDALDAEALIRAGQDADLVLNALNPPYEAWAKTLLPMTQAVLAACEALGLPQIAVGNLYAYGKDMPARLTETTPKAPSNPLAKVRYAADQAMAASRVPTLLFRGGDFLEGTSTGNWFDTYMTQDVAKGRFAYPGPADLAHSFAYLPDMARAAVGLAEQMDDQDGFQEVLFPGYTLTGQQLCDLTAEALDTPLKLTRFPWPVLRAMALMSPRMRGVVHMSYLWRTPHEVEGAEFAKRLPAFRATPIKQAFVQMLAAKSPAANRGADLQASPA